VEHPIASSAHPGPGSADGTLGYLSLAIPSVLAGLAASRFGLTHTYVVFGAAAAITCAAAGWLGSRLTAERRRPHAEARPAVDDTPRS